jgi:hypothetical protein
VVHRPSVILLAANTGRALSQYPPPVVASKAYHHMGSVHVFLVGHGPNNHGLQELYPPQGLVV